MEKVRVDKWLWSVRIFKSRSKATAACKNGKVKIGKKKLKASFLLAKDSTLLVEKGGFNLVFFVDKIINKRVGYPVAITCYQDLTPKDELDKFKSWFVGKGKNEFREKGEGRPTKRDRRKIDEFKSFDLYNFDEE